MILQLNPPIPIKTPKGKAIANFLLCVWISAYDVEAAINPITDFPKLTVSVIASNVGHVKSPQ